jgi:phosphoglycolate phosphatase-like HAD superfamily hydrolase
VDELGKALHPVTDDHQLAALLAPIRHVMLDFDGPICNLFAGRPAAEIADRLRALVAAEMPISAEQADETDPLAFARSAPSLPFELGAHVTAALRVEELAAAETAALTSGILDLFDACEASDRVISVVSNNIAEAVNRFLDHHDLAKRVAFVAGRPDDPTLMKPHHYMLQKAMRAVGQDPNQTVFVGDSITDMQAASAAGVLSIGYANKPGKHESLSGASADIIVDDINHAARLLRR